VPFLQEAELATETVGTGVENLASTGIRSPGRPTRRESLYRIRSSALRIILYVA